MNSAKAQDLVLATLSEKPKTIWRLFRELDFDEKSMVFAVNSLLLSGKIREKNSVLSTVKKTWKRKDESCSACSGSNIIIGKETRKKAKQFEKMVSGFHPVDESFQQSRINAVDIFRKAIFMRQNGDIEGKKIFVLGDDDLFSIAVQMVASPKKVTVLEFDKRVIRKIREAAEIAGCKIETRHYDARDSLPKKFIGKFDSFTTEPPEARPAMEAFLGRCFRSLKKEAGVSGCFGLSRLESSMKKWREIQSFMLSKGAVVTDIIRSFTEYPDIGFERENAWQDYEMTKQLSFTPKKPGTVWWTASLFRVEFPEKPAKLPNKKIGKKGFYCDEDTLSIDPTQLSL